MTEKNPILLNRYILRESVDRLNIPCKEIFKLGEPEEYIVSFYATNEDYSFLGFVFDDLGIENYDINRCYDYVLVSVNDELIAKLSYDNTSEEIELNLRNILNKVDKYIKN